MYIDAHCHLDLPAFEGERAAVVERAREVGVTRFVVAGVDPIGWASQRNLARRESSIIWTAGLHPVRCAQMSDAEWNAALAALPDCFSGLHPAVAVGETGLDRVFADRSTLPRQLACFREHLALARTLDRPVVLHVVGAHGACLEALRADGLPHAGGMVHSFSGSAEVAGEYLRLGLHLSLSGSVARFKSERNLRAVREIPDNRLLLETDAPDQCVRSGERSEPAQLIEVAECVAKVRGCTSLEILRHSAANCARLLGA